MAGPLYRIPGDQRWVIESFGEYNRTVGPGLVALDPIRERIREKHTVSEQRLELFAEPIDFDFTDGSSGTIVGMLAYINIDDPRKATYKAKDWREAVVDLLETKMRAALTTLTEQDARQLQKNVLLALDPEARQELYEALAVWGIRINRVGFKDIKLSQKTIAARSALFEQKRKEDMASIESRIRAKRGMGTYIASYALSQGLTFEEAQAAIAKSPKLRKESREFARILTQDAMKLDAGALKEWNINVPQGTTLEGLATVLGEALARSGGSGGSRSLVDGSDSSGKKKKSGGKFEGFDNIDEAEKWMDDLAEKRI